MKLTWPRRFRLALFTLIFASLFGVLATAWLITGLYIIWWLIKDPDAGSTFRRFVRGEMK